MLLYCLLAFIESCKWCLDLKQNNSLFLQQKPLVVASFLPMLISMRVQLVKLVLKAAKRMAVIVVKLVLEV